MAEFISIEERLRMIEAREEQDRRDRERGGHHPGDAHSRGDLFDDVLTAMANHLAGYNRERHQDAIRAGEREAILREIRERAEQYLREAPTMPTLAQRSREIDKAAYYFSERLPLAEREQLHKYIEAAQRQADARAIELQAAERARAQERERVRLL